MTNIISVADYVNTFNLKNIKIPDYGLAYLEMKDELEDLLGDEPKPHINLTLDSANSTTFRNYQKGRSTPKSVKAIQALKKQGIEFPLNYEDPIAKKVIRWYVKSLLSGSLDYNFFPKFNIHPNKLEKSTEILVDLKQQFQNDYVFKESGNDIGRILYLMGIPAGERKSTATTNYSQFEKCIQYPNLVKILIDELLIQMNSKSRRPSHILTLPSHRKEDPVKKIGKQVENFLKGVYPQLNLKFNLYKSTRQRNEKKEVLFKTELRIPDSIFEAMQA